MERDFHHEVRYPEELLDLVLRETVRKSRPYNKNIWYRNLLSDEDKMSR
jgi:hypothetical protein